MKQKIKILLLLPAMMLLSACSLTGGGSDGGIFRSDDGGKTFSPKNAAENNRTIGAVDVLSAAFNPQDGNILYIGTKASGIFKSENGGDFWKQLKVSLTTPAKVYAVAVDPAVPDTVFVAAVIGGRGKIVKSFDGGGTWKDVYSEPANGSMILSLAVSPRNPSNIFAGTDKGQIILSEDGGETWRSAHWTENNGAVFKIVFDSADANIAYFLVYQKGVLKTSDKGKSFQALFRKQEEGMLSSRNELDGAVSIEADPLRGNWVYVGTSEGLLRSKNGGDSWDLVKTLNKPDELNIRSIAINPQNSDEIACSVAQAFYKSNDGGVNWMPVQFNSSKTLEIVKYNPGNPSQIFVGLNKR